MPDKQAIREALRDDLATIRVVNQTIRTCANCELSHWLKVRNACLRNVRYNLFLLHAPQRHSKETEKCNPEN